MKICIPVEKNNGLESVPFNHFGSAPYFIIYDSESKKIKEINNEDLHHVHGMCQPLKALGGEDVDAILVGGIGAGALMKLNSQGIKVYKVKEDVVEKNIELLQNGELQEFSANHTCNHDGCGH